MTDSYYEFGPRRAQVRRVRSERPNTFFLSWRCAFLQTIPVRQRLSRTAISRSQQYLLCHDYAPLHHGCSPSLVSICIRRIPTGRILACLCLARGKGTAKEARNLMHGRMVALIFSTGRWDCKTENYVQNPCLGVLGMVILPSANHA